MVSSGRTEITIDNLVEKGQFAGVGNLWYCEVQGCHERMAEMVWFLTNEKYYLCKEHFQQYLSAFNYASAKRNGYV